MHIQNYFITNSLFRHQKLASNLNFLRLAQLFFLFLKENVSFLQKTDQIFTVSQILSDFDEK